MSPARLNRPEVVIVYVTTNVPSQVRAFFTGVAKVKTREGPRQIYVFDSIVEAHVEAPGRRPRHPAIEVENGPVRAKERLQRCGDSRTVECVCRGILRMVRRRAQRGPSWIGLGVRVAVLVCPLDGSVGTPG